jgi:hypothetical protein
MFTNQQITLGFKKSTWFNSIQVDKYMTILNESILKEQENQLDLGLGESFIECNNLTNISCLGNIETYLHYFENAENNSLFWFLCYAMGNNTLVDLDINTARRLIELTNNLNGMIFTLTVDKIVAIHEFPSIKLDGFRIYGDMNNIIRIQFYIVANNRKIDSLINTKIILDALSYNQIIQADKFIPYSLNMAEIYLGDYGSSLTQYGVSNIDFKYVKGLSYDYVTSGNNESIEPIEDKESEITFDIIMPYYSLKEFIEDYDLNTFKYGKLILYGKTINGMYANKFTLNMYKMKIINESDIINSIGLQPLKLKFFLLNDDLQGKKPFDIEIISKDKNIIN